MALFRGISLHLWSANGLTAEWHEGREGPYYASTMKTATTARCTPCPSSFARSIGPSAPGYACPSIQCHTQPRLR
jgi:hypothetical protein